MTEPKKYTAKEAMHWMIDHPREEMICKQTYVEFRFYGFSGIGFQRSQKGNDAWSVSGLPLGPSFEYYIRSEYDAWQQHLEQQAKPEPDESEPKVGESLKDYLLRIDTGLIFSVDDARQRWIEANFVRKPS